MDIWEARHIQPILNRLYEWIYSIPNEVLTSQQTTCNVFASNLYYAMHNLQLSPVL